MCRPSRRVEVRNSVVMIVLAILAAATWVVAPWSRPDPSPPAQRGIDPRPLGYHVRGAQILGTDEEGRVTYRINAARLDEVPNEERFRLEDVSVAYQPPDETAWTISAGSGSWPKDGSRLELANAVELRTAPTDGSRPRTILTEQLRFWPAMSSVESDTLVQFRLGEASFDGVGFHMDLKEDTLKLESEVHGTLVPR